MLGENLRTKQFDTELGNFINTKLAEGISVSTVVLALDKYLLSAKLLEADIIKQETAAIPKENDKINNYDENSTKISSADNVSDGSITTTGN